MASTSSQQSQGMREDEHVASPSESTSSLLGNLSANTTLAPSYLQAGPLAGLNIVVTCACISLVLHDKLPS